MIAISLQPLFLIETKKNHPDKLPVSHYQSSNHRYEIWQTGEGGASVSLHVDTSRVYLRKH